MKKLCSKYNFSMKSNKVILLLKINILFSTFNNNNNINNNYYKIPKQMNQSKHHLIKMRFL